ncbi:MAG TPA: hypothetical protein VMF51_14335 [Nocardioides sp.]|uniref:hypothetical protein n=1 Tax=Nocardioides sp. TaxID=35761 RepID=UPI002BC65526|nr:hypothetical protein [Nocardioides sp.]HTW16309.1 hypothetical protein [Nocardioides sp.]
MESDRLDPREARRIAERAEAAPFVDYPPTPWWYAPAAGLWAGSFTLLAGVREHGLAVLGLLALVAVESAFLAWYSRYHGAFPSLRRAPREFRPAFARYFVGLALVLLLVVGAWVAWGVFVAAVVAAVSVAAGLALYERTYARAAARTRDRLA